jgi:hypothetical protein
MISVQRAIRGNQDYKEIIGKTDINEVSVDLRDIAQDAGLGVALLVAWQHGLEIKFIPHTADGPQSEEGATVKPAEDGCPYVFVHVPVRRFRGDKRELVRRGIMSENADPAQFIYHEDGLIGTFSFQNPSSVSLTEARIKDILRALAQQGILVRANIDNRQVQFKDLGAKRRIQTSGEEIYVRVEDLPLTRSVRLPHVENPKTWEYIEGQLSRRSACNYCSVHALTPKEITIHSAHTVARTWQQDHELATVRNYQLGFTFAPFGDPREVCHFLAWDFPHINDLVINMEPQVYSFSDLIRLVRVINRDIRKFRGSAVEPFSISGSCNHFAGNSIYHQHYQFFHIPDLPLLTSIADTRRLVAYNGIEVARIDTPWPSTAFRIRSLDSGRDADVMAVADRVAREWRLLSEGKDKYYGNRIAINNHTQNIFVTVDDDDRLDAIFIPRHRHKLHALDKATGFEKKNAGVLEMMGYFIIDDPTIFCKIFPMPASGRQALGDSWLRQLRPDEDIIEEFEKNIIISLSDDMWSHEEQIDKILTDARKHSIHEISKFVAKVRRDKNLKDAQRDHLYRELLSAVLESYSDDSTLHSPS